MKKEIIINNLNVYMKKKGIKQKWIADMLDTNKMTISNILNLKTKKIDLDEIGEIANVLDLTIEELSDENFQVREDIFEDIKTKKTAIAFCGDIDIKEENTREAVETLLGLINVIDTVKTANENMESFNF